jgi:hypothetical protein
MIKHKNLISFILFFIYVVIFYYSIKYNPFKLSLLDEITLYYNGLDGISGKLGSHLLNNLTVNINNFKISNFFFFSNKECIETNNIIIHGEVYCPWFGSYYVNVILFTLLKPKIFNNNLIEYVHIVYQLNLILYSSLFSFIAIKVNKYFSFFASLILVILICLSPYLLVWGRTIGETIFFLLILQFLGLFMGPKIVKKKKKLYLFFTFIFGFLCSLSKYQYAQFGLIFAPFFYIYFCFLEKINFKEIILNLIQNYFILFLSLITALLFHTYLAEIIISDYNLTSKVINSDKNFLLSVIEVKKDPLNVACGVRGFFDHVWIKFSAPAISFVTTNIVSMFFLVLLFLLRIFFLYINKRFDGEYYFLFILSFSTIFLYPIAIKTWCVNLRHAYDEIVNYLPILILVYIWIGNILSKYFNQKYFIIFIFILFILSNLIQLII